MSKRLPRLITVSEPECHSSHQSFLQLLSSPHCVCSLFLCFLFPFFFSPDLFITLQLQLICSGKLGPSTSLSVCLGRARVSWVRGQKEEEERKRQRDSLRIRNCQESEESKGTEAGFTYESWPFLLSNIWHKAFSVIFFLFHTTRVMKKTFKKLIFKM